ncbi:MAG TPA: flagellar M-ring protein FliF, partial [Opitutaceae bacterium]|nr:flagellar M-ring protein FliF [Opitutaceae bacterium]
QIVLNALGVKPAAGQSIDSVVTLQEIPFQSETVSAGIERIESATRVQGWIDGASRYVAVAVALGVLVIFWRMLGRQKPETVPVELLTVDPRDAQRQIQGGGALTPELLNELIKQKPANIGTALRDWVAVKKS